MPGQGKSFAPASSYDVDLMFNNDPTNYGQHIESIRVVSSLRTAYQIVTINIFMDPKDIILNDQYGQNSIQLSIKLMGDNDIPKNSIDLDLMLISSDFDMAMRSQVASSDQEERSSIRLLTVVRKPFEIMTTMVNDIYGLIIGNQFTPAQVVEELVKKTEGSINIDRFGQNETIINQICVPPLALYQAIKYVDENFGIFKGVPVTFCQYDGVVNIFNLSSRIKQGSTFIITQLATDSDHSEVIEKSLSGMDFYTYDNINSTYVGNTKYAVMGKKLIHMMTPDDDLYATFEHDLDDIISDYGLVDRTKTIPVNTSVAKRVKYYHLGLSTEDDDAVAVSTIAKKIADVSTVSFGLDRNLIIDNLLRVGETVKLKTLTSEYSDLGGNYILKTSDLRWTKGQTWETTAQIELMRTNKTDSN